MIVGICEDNEQIRLELHAEIEKQKTGVAIQIHEFSSGEVMLQSKIPFDLVFLDIELDGVMTGLELAQQLQEQLQDLILVFISGYTKYITSAFHLHTFQFLLKPLDVNLFEEEFRRCIEKYRSAHDIFRILQGSETIEVEMKDIVYMESDRRKLLIHLKNGKIYEMYGKISDEEDKLSAHYFIRIHKSFLVNCRYIKKFKDEMVWVSSSKKEDLISLPVSRRCKADAQQKYYSYYLGVEK